MTLSGSGHSGRKLDEWLSYIEAIHATEIDMGLNRIQQVAKRLAIKLDSSSVITIGGTNGKGTTCAFLENIILKKGLDVAVYSSPHIHRFNERLRINKQDVRDELFIQAFEQVEASRGNVSLTYYEFTTLAALVILQQSQPDYILLEVGLGGRLDATNIIDADIAVITTVDLDHQAFLGNDRESIGFEKAGIMRTKRPAVVGDSNPPNSLLAHAKSIGTELYLRNHAFSIVEQADNWCWTSPHKTFDNLPVPNIPKDNVATALAVMEVAGIEVDNNTVIDSINETKVSGRTEIHKLHCDVMLDVGHNPLAARYLADVLSQNHYRNVYAVVGMLSDKDVKNTLLPLLPKVDTWFLGGLPHIERGRTGKR